jgi:hypothetical protein
MSSVHASISIILLHAHALLSVSIPESQTEFSNAKLIKIYYKASPCLRPSGVQNVSARLFCILTLYITCFKFAITSPNDRYFKLIHDFKHFLPVYGVIGGAEINEKFKLADPIFQWLFTDSAHLWGQLRYSHKLRLVY